MTSTRVPIAGNEERQVGAVPAACVCVASWGAARVFVSARLAPTGASSSPVTAAVWRDLATASFPEGMLKGVPAPCGSVVGVPEVGVLRGVVEAGDVDVVGAVGGYALCGGDGADGCLNELLVGDSRAGDDVNLGGVADLGQVVGVLLVGGDGGLRFLVVILVEDLARGALAVVGTLSVPSASVVW